MRLISQTLRIPLKLVDVTDLMQRRSSSNLFASYSRRFERSYCSLFVCLARVALPRSAIDEYTKYIGIYGAERFRRMLKSDELEKGIEGLQSSKIVKFIEPIVLDLLKRVGAGIGRHRILWCR